MTLKFFSKGQGISALAKKLAAKMKGKRKGGPEGASGTPAGSPPTTEGDKAHRKPAAAGHGELAKPGVPGEHFEPDEDQVGGAPDGDRDDKALKSRSLVAMILAKARKPPLGSGERFAQLKGKLGGRKGVRDPGALAAYIGRKKYGKKRFAKLAQKAGAAKWLDQHAPLVTGGDLDRRINPVAKSGGPECGPKSIGTTRSGKQVFGIPSHSGHWKYDAEDHDDAARIHEEAGRKTEATIHRHKAQKLRANGHDQFAKADDGGKKVCPNCGQWQHPHQGKLDCMNQCVRRGFAPKGEGSRGGTVIAHTRSGKARYQPGGKVRNLGHAREILREHGHVIKKTEHGEYRVAKPSTRATAEDSEAGAYYSDDLDDAVATGVDMHKRETGKVEKSASLVARIFMRKAMTKRHFEDAAAHMREQQSSLSPEEHSRHLDTLSSVFRGQNPRFDEGRFRTASGEGSRGGVVKGRTKSGRAVYQGGRVRPMTGASKKHFEAAAAYMRSKQSSLSPEEHKRHVDTLVNTFRQTNPRFDEGRFRTACGQGSQGGDITKSVIGALIVGSIMQKAKGEGSRGGHVVGHYTTGKPKYERGRIKSGPREGMGGFLNPPGHPEHTMSVETDLRRRPENRGAMSLGAAAEAEWLHPATRAEAKRHLANWHANKLPLDHPDVVDWRHRVLGYFKNSWKGDGAEPWNVANLRSTMPPGGSPNDHAGVHLIQKYYPEYQPTPDDWAGAYWGTKPGTVEKARSIVSRALMRKAAWQPKTGQACSCKPGVQRDNCPQCEGTGQRIDFAAIHRARAEGKPSSGPKRTGEGARGGTVIGHTKSGKPIYSAHGHPHYTDVHSKPQGERGAALHKHMPDFTNADHHDAADAHMDHGGTLRMGSPERRSADLAAQSHVAGARYVRQHTPPKPAEKKPVTPQVPPPSIKKSRVQAVNGVVFVG